MASNLPEELVEEILLRVPPDEPAHLVHATLVCKAWHNILSDHSFLRRYRRFHGAPPLLGYICNYYYKDLTIRVVPTTSIAASPFGTPTFHCSSRTFAPFVLDCRHGRVLIQAEHGSQFVDRLIVWDPVAGGQQHLSVPPYPHYPYEDYMGAVLCTKDGCDHLDCHGGSFLIVLVGFNTYDHDNGGTFVHTWASVYSSETCAWSAPTPNDIINQVVSHWTPSIHIGDALYFTASFTKCSILKYDLSKHELSVMDWSEEEFWPVPFKADDGGLGVAAMLNTCIHMWLWQVGIKGIGRWVKNGVIKFNDMPPLPKYGLPGPLICMAEGTSIVFISTHTAVFTLDLKSRQVRKICERENLRRPILPYMSFYPREY